MRFQGSNTIEEGGKTYIRIRNKTLTYLEAPQNLLDILGDLRYVELYLDHADQIWVKKPAGRQKTLPKPYVIVTTIKNVLDSRTVMP